VQVGKIWGKHIPEVSGEIQLGRHKRLDQLQQAEVEHEKGKSFCQAPASILPFCFRIAVNTGGSHINLQRLADKRATRS